MNYVTAQNNYIVVEPSGDIRGFVELSDARSFISCYYLNNILEYRPQSDSYKSYFDIYQEKDQEAVNYIAGVDEGECRIYDLDSVIEKIREKPYFEDEKEELISKFLPKDIHLNIYDYGIDDIFAEAKEEWTV